MNITNSTVRVLKSTATTGGPGVLSFVVVTLLMLTRCILGMVYLTTIVSSRVESPSVGCSQLAFVPFHKTLPQQPCTCNNEAESFLNQLHTNKAHTRQQ